MIQKRKKSPRRRTTEALKRSAEKAKAKEKERIRAREAYASELAEHREKARAAFSRALDELMGADPTAFEKETGLPHSTVQGWVQAQKSYSVTLPAAETLRLLSATCDVSVDYLLGFPVPRRRSGREPVGELARALVDHVRAEYHRKRGNSHPYVDGLCQVLHGKRYRHPDNYSDVKVADPQLFLADVANWAYEAAENKEITFSDEERAAFLRDIEWTLSRMHLFAEQYEGEDVDLPRITRRLLQCATNPPTDRNRAHVNTIKAELEEIERLRWNLQDIKSGTTPDQRREWDTELLHQPAHFLVVEQPERTTPTSDSVETQPIPSLIDAGTAAEQRTERDASIIDEVVELLSQSEDDKPPSATRSL